MMRAGRFFFLRAVCVLCAVAAKQVIDIAGATTEPRFAVDRLISESNERWMREEQVIDDTTVCVAFLGNYKQGAVGK